MKNYRYTQNVFVVLMLLATVLFSSCRDEVLETITYKTQIAYLTTTDSVRAMEVASQRPRDLETPGRIYIYGDYLFINDVKRGIHVVDNSNPASPVFLNFINIPGNEDLAVYNNILYADSYVDLLAFDISNPKQVKFKNRVNDVFGKYYYNRNTNVIVAYKDTVITYTQTKGLNHRPGIFPESIFASSNSSGGKASGTGVPPPDLLYKIVVYIQ